MNTIKSLKLITGEEVVTEVDEITNVLLEEVPRDTRAAVRYRLRRPHVLQFQQVAPGRVGLAFVPWALSNPDIDEVVIGATSVVAVFTPADRVEKEYRQQTSGITIADAGLIKQ